MPDEHRYECRPRRRFGLPRALSSLRHRDYALYAFGQLVSNSGSWMQNTAQGFLVYQLTGSAMHLGIVAALGTFPVLFLTLPAGFLADRFAKRKIILFTQTALLLQATVLALLDITGYIQIWHIMALALISGIAGAIDVPARQAFTFDLVGRDDLLNAITLNSAIFNITRIIGPTMAGIIVAAYGTQICFSLNAVSYVAALLALILMKNVPSHGFAQAESMLNQVKEGLRYSFTHVTTRDLLIMTGVASMFVMQYSTLLPAFAKEDLAEGARGLGYLMSSIGVGALIAATVVASIGGIIKNSRIILFGAFIAPFGLLGMSLSKTLPIAMGFIALVGMGMMSFMTVSNSVIQIESPDDMRGRVMAVRNLVFSGLSPVGALTLGWIAQRFSVGLAMQCGALIFAMGAIVLTIRTKITFGGH